MQRLVRLMLIATLSAALTVGTLPTVVRASSTVTSLLDNGTSGTLRSVIAAAPLGDTITFSVTGAITLNSGLGTLILSKNVTIQGPGAGVLAIDGGCATCGAGGAPSGGVTVFTVNSAVTASISGLTIRHGNAGSGDGGGINSSGTLTVASSTVSGNTGATGGGITSSGTLTVTNSSIVSGNAATTAGGGIASTNGGAVMVTNSTISGNTATGHGGGIYNFNSMATLSNSTVRANTTAGGIGNSNGGGIYTYGPLSVTGGTIGGPSLADGNQAGGSGGGIYLSSVVGVTANFSLSGVTVSHNTASDPQTSGGGGGLFLQLQNYPDTATITNSTISNNTATDAAGGDGGDGGGISNSGPNDGAGNATTTTITNSTISGNTCYDAGADGVGGGIANFGGKLNLTNSTVSGNTASGAVRGDGGGIYNQDELNVTGSTISGNTATSGSGGGVWTENGAAPVGTTVTNSTIVGNAATRITAGIGGLGGGFFAKGRLALTYATVARNTATTGGGGVYNGSSVRPLGTIIAANSGGDCSVFGSSVFLSQGYNLDDDGSCGLTMPTDRPNDATPGLAAALAANGSAGPQTLALLPGSNAINHGGTSANGCPATDERGIMRPQPSGGQCDIGAFEALSATTPTLLPSPPQPAGPHLPGPPTLLPMPPQPAGPSNPAHPNPLPSPRP